MPPLKDRLGDIPVLVEYFIRTLSEKLGKRVLKIKDEALAILEAYNWPGNVRELRNAIEQSIVMCQNDAICLDCLPEYIRKACMNSASVPEKDQKRYIKFLKAYNDSHGNISRVAKIMNVSRPTVYSWMKKFGVGEADSA